MKKTLRPMPIGEHAKAKAKVPVSMRALIARINRKLVHQDEVLKIPRSERLRSDCGDYYILDTHHNCIAFKNVDPESTGRELGVLKPYERVVE